MSEFKYELTYVLHILLMMFMSLTPIFTNSQPILVIHIITICSVMISWIVFKKCLLITLENHIRSQRVNQSYFILMERKNTITTHMIISHIGFMVFSGLKLILITRFPMTPDASVLRRILHEQIDLRTRLIVGAIGTLGFFFPIILNQWQH